MENNSVSLIHFTSFGDVTVGTIDNASMLDAMTVTDFGEQVIAYLEGKSKVNLLLNFMIVKYMSSAALTELIRINDAVKATDGTMCVCNVSEDIQKIFTITNFGELFEIHTEDLEHCVNRFQRVIDLQREEDDWSSRNQ